MSSSAPSIAAVPAPAPGLRSLAVSRRLLGRFAPYKLRTWLILLLQFVRIGLELASPLLLGTTIGSLDGFEATHGALPARFTTLVAIYAVTVVLRSVAQYISAYATVSLAQDVENGLRSELFAKVMRLRFRWHDENRSGKTIARSLRDMEKAKGFFREVFFGYVEMAIVAVGVVVLSFALHWTYGALALVLLWGPLLVTAWSARRIAIMDKGISDQYDRVTTALQENVAGARVVRAFGREPEEIEKFGGRLGVFTSSWKVLVHFWTTLMPILHHTSYLVSPAAIFVGAWRYAAAPGPARLGEVVAVLLYLRTARDRLRPLTRLVLVGQEAVASAVRVFEVLDRDDDTPIPASPRALPAKGGDLAFDDVTFAYPNGRKVLDGLSLHVARGLLARHPRAHGLGQDEPRPPRAALLRPDLGRRADRRDRRARPPALRPRRRPSGSSSRSRSSSRRPSPTTSPTGSPTPRGTRSIAALQARRGPRVRGDAARRATRP